MLRKSYSCVKVPLTSTDSAPSLNTTMQHPVLYKKFTDYITLSGNLQLLQFVQGIDSFSKLRLDLDVRI